uniref:Uncharacterized protein n=1 Tax=Rhizophora mucronata TaxID=61149 RepID=A0A2P2QE16_RHIMU
MYSRLSVPNMSQTMYEKNRRIETEKQDYVGRISMLINFAILEI